MFLVFREKTFASLTVHFRPSSFVFSGSFPQTQVSPLYFDREDVKKVIHAPLNTNWTECSTINVFPNGDSSLPPAFTVLPGVIEKNKRTVIVHGLVDYILIAEG
jgi:carboxypeptidase D